MFLAPLVSPARDMLYLGRDQDYPLALEGALKLKEISFIIVDVGPRRAFPTVPRHGSGGGGAWGASSSLSWNARGTADTTGGCGHVT